ncbi:MAG: PTS sugar transporter subunit IIA [Hespellia sp.]|nr:PTS sugar transporter subunit IIA [Hespellia sp.]
MDTRPQILLLTHGGWGMSLLKGVQMILGTADFVSEIALLPEMTFSEYYQKVEEKVKTLSKDSVIMTDVFGGTTTNVAAKLGRDFHFKVYSGLNAAMLLEACSQIEFSGDVEPECILEAGKSAVKDVVEEVLNSMNKEN